MKFFLILILSLSLSIAAFAQADSLGFTNKAEAENKMVNGLKEGKWCEGIDSGYDSPLDDGLVLEVRYYRLAIYRHGIPVGIVRDYNINTGKLWRETPYINGVISGIYKEYFIGGKPDKVMLRVQIPYQQDKENGILKRYYFTGELNEVRGYVKGTWNEVDTMFYKSGKVMIVTEYGKYRKKIILKEYYENGKLKSQTILKNGVFKSGKSYDESGNEIK